MIELLGIGIPWNVIEEMSPQDMSYVVAFHSARTERHHEIQAEQEAKTYSKYNT